MTRYKKNKNQNAHKRNPNHCPVKTFRIHFTIMDEKIFAAKKLLDCINVEMNKVNIKTAFQTCIRKGHPDKGGSNDIHKMIQARDLLLANLSISSTLPSCATKNCKESPTIGNYCAFHDKYR